MPLSHQHSYENAHYWVIQLFLASIQASERRVQESQDRMLDYERRASDHKQLISELTQKVTLVFQ